MSFWKSNKFTCFVFSPFQWMVSPKHHENSSMCHALHTSACFICLKSDNTNPSCLCIQPQIGHTLWGTYWQNFLAIPTIEYKYTSWVWEVIDLCSLRASYVETTKCTSEMDKRRNILPPSQNDCPTSRIFIVPKWLSGLFARREIEAQSQIFSCQTFIIKKFFDTATLGGVSE